MINQFQTPSADLQHQYDLLQKEFEYEKEMYREQTERTGIHRRIQQGVCWYPAIPGRSYYNSLNQLVVEVERRDDKEIEHNFEYGRPVCFFTTDVSGKPKYLNFSAIISYVQDDRMVVVLPTPSALFDLQNVNSELGVQLYFDETSYKTMFNALSGVMKAKNDRLAYLRDVLLGKSPVTRRTLFPVRFPWLNTTQEEAVNHVLATKEVSIVHGPPGTGKTTTLVEAIYETLHREPQVLVCAQSNTAVDWISEKLVDRGVNVLRIGNPTRVNDKMLSFTYERRFEGHPAYSELWSIRKAVREMGRKHRGSYEERESARNRMSRLRDRATQLEIQINADLFDNAHVIASTLVSSNHRILNGHRFGTLFIDEAAQALEAACWIAIRKADRVVLAGDHCQLPPTIKCYEAARGGLESTLMERVVANKPSTVSLLKVQYRMHEEIMKFPSQWFYNGELEAAPEIRYRGILDWDTPISWIDTSEMDFKEEFVGETFGRINKAEADLLLQELKVYINRIGGKRVLEERIDFGIISPYKAQVQYLRNKIKASGSLKPYRSLLTVNTVDGFQGQERDVIFISLVRANEEGQIGFLNDLRRMNVAITRARMKLVILGEANTLKHHKFYHKLIEHIQQISKT